MPTFQEIYNKHNAAISQGLISPDESLSTFAQRGYQVTGDPSYKNVAEGGWFSNAIRSRSADLSNFVNSGPVDEWTSEAVGQIGDLFGITPEASRSMGARLPRMVVDFLPMMAAAPFTGGASLLPAVGMGVTSALSAASAYEDTGDVGSAIIGGAAPYLGTALAQRGGQAALGLAAKSPALQKLGFTGGTKYVNAALSEAERASLAASGNLSAEAIAGATVNKTVVEKLADKGLGYLGGQLAANAGFFGIDTAYHGPSTTFNRDYLFNSLVGNVAFGLADIPRAFRPNVLPGSQKFNLPEASPIYLSDGERRAILAASKFADLKSPEAVREYRQKYGLDMADIAIRTEELATALNRKELGLREAEDTFTTKWNNYVQNSPEAQQAGIQPVQQGGAFGKERLNVKELMGQEGLPIEAQKIVDEYRMKRTSLKKEVNGVIARLGKPVNTVESLKLGVQQLNLDEFLQTPIEQRDYVKALEGTMLSLDGADLIRDVHRVQAGLEPVRGDLYQKYVDLFAGKDVELTPDKSMELLVAASLARGQTPKFTRAKEKVKQAVEEGQTDDVVAKKAVEGVIEENKVSVQPFRQPVIPDDTLSGLVDLGQKSGADLTKGMVNRPGGKQQFIPDQVESGLTEKPPVSPADLVSGLSKKEVKPQVEQTVEQSVLDEPVPLVKRPIEELFNALVKSGSTATGAMAYQRNLKAVQEDLKLLGERKKELVKFINEHGQLDYKVTEFKLAEALLESVPVQPGAKLFDKYDADTALKETKVQEKKENKGSTYVSGEDRPEAKLGELFNFATDSDGVRYLIPLPEGEFQQVEQFARSLMSKLVSPEMLPESSKELVDLAKLFNNPEVAYAELGKMVKGKSDVQFAKVSLTPTTAIHYGDGGIAGDTTLRRMDAGRSTGHFGTGVYFVSSPDKAGSRAVRPKVYLDLTGLNLAKPLGQEALELHDRLREFNRAVFKGEALEFAEPRFAGRKIRNNLSLILGLTKQPESKVEAAMKKVESLFANKLNDGLRTPSTYLMQELGYDGIDARNTPADNGDFGSVIYPKQESDVQFARASAGAFDFGMREVQNGKLVRPGKPPLGTKDGWMTELEFRVNGGDLGPLQKDEVAFYKQLVPEAFANDKVHLQKLWDGLGKVGEQVKVVTYGQEAKVNPEKLELDQLTHNFYDTLSVQDQIALANAASLDPAVTNPRYPENKENIERVIKLKEKFGDVVGVYIGLRKKQNQGEFKDNGPRATSYYNQISPFDTKKFPVLRVDVVLPQKRNLSERSKELERRTGIKATDEEEGILWQQDNTHENLPNTLGWAMVQIVPDPKTGEKVMFVGEAQSRWGQSVQKTNKERQATYAQFKQDNPKSQLSYEAYAKMNFGDSGSHPLLPIHQNLILKAVIKEAQKQGITKVAISDGETAMMTEGHDTNAKETFVIKPTESGLASIKEHESKKPRKTGHTNYVDELLAGKTYITTQESVANWAEAHGLNVERQGKKVEQEGGMRLAYDPTYWTNTDSKGRDTGVYKSEQEAIAAQKPGEQAKLREGKLNLIMSKLVGEGEMRDFGVHKNAWATGVGIGGPDAFQRLDNQIYELAVEEGLTPEQAQIRVEESRSKRKPDGSPVFRNPDGTPKTNVTARVYDISNPSPRTDTLFAQNQGRVYGAASYKAKQILINSKAFQGLKASDRAAFVFAHEQSHISFAKAIEGKYGSQAKIQAEKALAWVNAADPQAKKNVEDVLKELHLDKELAQMDGIRDVLNNPDPQEWLANVMGMYGFGTVKAKAPKQAFAMLPKPIRQFAEWMVQHLQNLSKGAMTWLKLSGKDYEGAKKAKELFDSIRRSYRQAEWEAAQAERFLDIEPTSMFDRGEEYAFAKSGEKMGEVGEQPFKDAPKRWIGGMWNKIIQPMHTLGNLYEGFKQPVMAVFNAHSDTENAIGDVFKVVVGELGADEKVRMTNEAFKKVMGSEQLNKLFNQIQVRSQVLKKRMIKLNDQNTSEVLDFEALSPELRGRFQQFNPEAQKALATMIAQAERANILHQEKILQGEWQGSVHDFATLLASKVSFNKQDYGKAVEISKGVLNDLKMANETRSEFDQQRFMAQAQSKLAQLEASDQVSASVQAQEIFKRYDDLKKYYDDHPTWMSFRRYGKIKQRIEKNGEFDVIDADTEKELAETLKLYFDQGWKRVGERQVVEKKLQGQYYLNDALLKVMQDRENQFRTMLEESNISAEEKARLLAVPSATSAMISEINSRELYRPTKGRKLTGDLERFDWWEQFQRYTPAALAAAQRRALGAKINYWMQNPELNNLKLQKDQFMALYEQSKKPDPEWARKLNKLNAVWHIGWNLPGHIAEVFQPMLSGVHELVAKGESLPGALKQFYKTEKEVAKVWGYRLKDKFFKPEDARFEVDGVKYEGLPALWLRVHGDSPENVNIAKMLHAKRDRIQKAPLSEIRNFTGEQHAKLQDVISGNRQRTLGEIIASPFTMYASAAMNFYSKFTQHNGIVTMVTAYRKFKKQGMTHEQAMDAAELFDLTVNNSGGRLERPEMFGKLGGAGHLPYGLTSYVRGRFSQLATYYRHGFETEAFSNLTPAERGNAKKAFQTMILAQLGAAGILGMPFVGASIALMEELLGEDLKGKMINALDEVTNDPTLTRVFTHGMMSTMAESFGLPADLHSRFALSSFLGTNSYDGMSAKSFMGPSIAMLDSMFNLGGQVAKGESLEKALTVAGPGGVKRLAEALGEEYQRENPESNLLMSMLGFRSSQQVKKKEWEQITRKQELETRRKLEQSAMEISKALEAGPANGRKQLLIEAEKFLSKDLDYQQTVKQRQQNIKDLIQKVSMIEADKVGPQDVRREISGRLAPVASQTAQSMGVQMSNPMELARALQQQKTRSQLGATVSQRPVRNAMLQEMQWGNNPWEF